MRETPDLGVLVHCPTCEWEARDVGDQDAAYYFHVSQTGHLATRMRPRDEQVCRLGPDEAAIGLAYAKGFIAGQRHALERMRTLLDPVLETIDAAAR